MAFYDSVLSPPPANSGAVPITNAIYLAWLGNTGGLLLVDGALQSAPVPPPSLAMQASVILTAGLTIASTSTPAVNGTYACDTDSTVHIQAELLSLLTTQSFTDGTTTIAWPDVAGTVHVFPSGAVFTAFAVAAGKFVASAFKVYNGTSTTLPAASVTIA
jgi:hypothetical protein